MRKIAFAIAAVMVLALTACVTQVEEIQVSATSAERYESLAKLGRVWGFVKYTHHAFLTGERCWDEELMRLIPIISIADEADVNSILYDWFVSLGYDGYDAGRRFSASARLQERQVADTSWISEDYLGHLLATQLQRFGGIFIPHRPNAPATFSAGGFIEFPNQNPHPDMDFAAPHYRLLGLFRVWNAMKYYYPHIAIIDVCWNEVLVYYVAMMLDGTCRTSYERTLHAMTSHLRDGPHISFSPSIFLGSFGSYPLPVLLAYAEGYIVVLGAFGEENPLQRGDIILSVNGRCIYEIAAERLRYLPAPTDEEALAFFALRQRLLSHTSNVAAEVRRGVDEMSFHFDVVSILESTDFEWVDLPSHVLLDSNIGLINPGSLNDGDVQQIMEDFSDTDGIIIDLRQYPSSFTFFAEMRQYLMPNPPPFVHVSTPSRTLPGWRADSIAPINQNLPSRGAYVYIYDRPVVLLMNEETISHGEWCVMAFRGAPNITVVGLNSMGSNGNIVRLPLPGGMTMTFTGLGVYTLDRGQTHFIGLEPDIRVKQTVHGIADGRDEIMEAAILFILSRSEDEE